MTLYDREGEPIEMAQWLLLFADRRYQVLAQTEVEGTMISTVWIGIDHSFGTSEPLIFETMLLGKEAGQQWRYATEAEALAHHDELVEQAKLVEAWSA